MQVKLCWDDAIKGEQHLVLTPPIALGRDPEAMQAALPGQNPATVFLPSKQVSRFHALIDEKEGQVLLEDRSKNGSLVNGEQLLEGKWILSSGDCLTIGPYRISVLLLQPVSLSGAAEVETLIEAEESPDTLQLQHPSTLILDEDPAVTSPQVVPDPAIFPPSDFQHAEHLPLRVLYISGDPVLEKDYVAIGGGLGSFCWVDTLRIYGISAHQIAVIGLEQHPYARYQRLCQNSQIPDHERLRSGSDSTPDNFWGWPGYAWREAASQLIRLQLLKGLRILWQVFAEPVLAETYTPQSRRVFASLDREAARIGWQQMLLYGRVRGIRKTEDGRYAIAYSVPHRDRREHRYVLARHIHLATGYPGVRFLQDLQDYRRQTGDYQSVVNAYEAHDHIYQHLEAHGGTVIIRGRGIVASRILQRLDEARRHHQGIKVIHLMRSPKASGNQYGPAQRPIENQWEFQPFNWPKACWGGDLRAVLEKASPGQRGALLTDWGGTTTADRKDWRQLIKRGLQEGWYSLQFGQVVKVDQVDGKLLAVVKAQTYEAEIKVEAMFIIDATGLDSDIRDNPLLADLVDHYHLPLNPSGRLQVSNDFEVEGMANQQGRMYAAGVVTLGGPYAAVDSFLGLQYSAQRSVDALAFHRAPGLRHLNGFRSIVQWFNWATERQP